MDPAAIVIRNAVYVVCLVHIVFSWYIMLRIYKFTMAITHDAPSKILARKGSLYASGVTLLQLPFLLWAIVQLVFGVESQEATDIANISLPLSGFLNMLVFM